MTTARFETVEGDDLVLESVKAKGSVIGRILDMHVEQHFRNPESTNVEVVYTFPLPWQAVLLGLEVELNGETLTAIVKAKSSARAEYEEALSEGNTGILLTVSHDRSYTLELGNLMASESCVIRLHYVQVLQPEQNSLRLMLPTTIAPLYGNAVLDGSYEPHAAPQISAIVEYPFDISFTIEGELALSEVGSPSHKVATRHLPAAGPQASPVMEVHLASKAWLDRDFILVFNELPQASMGLVAMDRKEPGLGVVMASFTPKLPEHQSLPVTMKILVDCSGSMNGGSIQAARSSLQGILSGLNETDRFSLSRFGTSVEHRTKALWKGAPAGLAAARRWAEKLEADLGGTEMNKAILSTLALPGAVRCDFLLITDGNIHAVDHVIESAQQSGMRFFVVGIGSSVREGPLRQLAEETGGSCEFVAAGEQVELAIWRLFNRMRSPVVNHARVEWPTGFLVHAASDLSKSIFDGDDLSVFARVQTEAAQSLVHPIRLYGTPEGEEDEILLAELTPAFIVDEGNALARLAANQRYWQLRRGSKEVPAVLLEQLPALAEKYQLVTDDTSLILVKERAEGDKAKDMPQPKKVESMLAAGWGGHGSVDSPRVLFSRSESSMRFGKDLSSSTAQMRVPDSSIRQLRMETPRMFRSNRSAKLRAFIDSLDTGPSQHEVAITGPTPPERIPAFWNDGEAYSQDSATWPFYKGLTPAGFKEWLRLNPEFSFSKYEDLADVGLPKLVLEWLEFILGADLQESDVVKAFAKELATSDFTLFQTVAHALRRHETAVASDGLGKRIAAAIKGAEAEKWPAAIVDFAESDTDDCPATTQEQGP